MFGALLGGGAVSASVERSLPPPQPSMFPPPPSFGGGEPSWAQAREVTAREHSMMRLKHVKERIAQWLDPSVREQTERQTRADLRAAQRRTVPASIACLRSFSAVTKERMHFDEMVRRSIEDRMERERNDRFWILRELRGLKRG
jgi:hypothetical protein